MPSGPYLLKCIAWSRVSEQTAGCRGGQQCLGQYSQRLSVSSSGADGTVQRIGVTSAGIARAVNPGGQVNFCQNILLPPAVTSTLQGIGLAIESTGGENGGGFIPLYIGNQTGASTGNAWGINVTVLQTAGTVVRQIIGTEMKYCQQSDRCHAGSGSQVGMSVNSGGVQNRGLGL